MQKIKNWSKFNSKPFRVAGEEIKRGDNFIFNDDGMIRKCTSVSSALGGRINNTFLVSACKKIVFDDNAKMDFDEEKFPDVVTTAPVGLKKGDTIYFLDYQFIMKGYVVSIGSKNIKISLSNRIGVANDIIYKPFDKVSLPDEMICVVWQQWKGIEGTYRIERKLYSSYQMPAKDWASSPRFIGVSESRFGVEDGFYK